jgi:hypothetical protein
MKNEKVLQRVKKNRNILHTIRRKKANWSGNILHWHCLLKYVIEGNMEGRLELTERRGRRCKQPLDDLKEMKKYCGLKEEALDRSLWRTRFGMSYGLVVRRTA